MGRELRRVPLDFDWEMHEVWEGFVCPYPHDSYERTCNTCDGTGYNAATKELYDTWYDLEGYEEGRWWYKYGDDGRACAIVEAYPGACKRWEHKLTQDEVDALVADFRFVGLTHDWQGPGKGWVPKNPPVKISADQVNAANAPGVRGLGHDTLNKFTCVRARAQRLGVYGECDKCAGAGKIVFAPEIKKLADAWEPESLPTGEGWQVWETVSEGSPVTPVFDTPEKLIDYLVTVGIWDTKYSVEAATAFVMKKGWVPSSLYVAGVGWLHNIESAPYMVNNESGSDNSKVEASSG